MLQTRVRRSGNTLMTTAVAEQSLRTFRIASTKKGVGLWSIRGDDGYGEDDDGDGGDEGFSSGRRFVGEVEKSLYM